MKTLTINDLKFYDKNAKIHNKKQVKQIAESIKAFGFNQAVVVDKNNTIIVGHGRVEAAKLLGWSEVRLGEIRAPKGAKFVPVVRVEDLSEDEIKAYRLADNKLNESPWDMNIVIEELRDIALGELNIEITGFDSDILSDIVEDKFDVGKAYEAIKEPKTKPGDIYELGEHRVMCGDAASDQDFRTLMSDKKKAVSYSPTRHITLITDRKAD